jgi:hypothetical protein
MFKIDSLVESIRSIVLFEQATTFLMRKDLLISQYEASTMSLLTISLPNETPLNSSRATVTKMC